MFAIIVKILLMLGAAVVAGLVVKTILLTLKAVLTKVKQKLSARYGTKVFAASMKKLAQELTKEAERKGNVHSVDELLKEMGNEGVILCTVNADGTVDEKEMDIISAQSVDNNLDRLMASNNGELVLTA